MRERAALAAWIAVSITQVVSGVPISTATSALRVLGAGVMGAGIAQWLGSRGLGVSLCDISPERVAAGLATIRRLNAKAVKRRIFSRHHADRAIDAITPVHAPDVSLERCDLIIEAAVEDMKLKKKIFTDLESRAGEHTILATNTSALSMRSSRCAYCAWK